MNKQGDTLETDQLNKKRGFYSSLVEYKLCGSEQL